MLCFCYFRAFAPLFHGCVGLATALARKHNFNLLQSVLLRPQPAPKCVCPNFPASTPLSAHFITVKQACFTNKNLQWATIVNYKNALQQNINLLYCKLKEAYNLI